MAEQKSRITLVKSVTLASVASGIGILTNVATGEHGGVLAWAGVVLLTVASGVVPYFGWGFRLPQNARKRLQRYALVAICLLFVYATTNRPLEYVGVQQNPSVKSSDSTRAKPVGIPRGIANPTPLDPESERVASRLTSAFQEADLLPSELILESSDPEWHVAPFEFFVDGNRFLSLANVRDELGMVYLSVMVYWSKKEGPESNCPPSRDDLYCESITLENGTRITDISFGEEESGLMSETVTLVQKDGIQVVVNQLNADREVTRKNLLLDSGRMADLAWLGARSLM